MLRQRFSFWCSSRFKEAIQIRIHSYNNNRILECDPNSSCLNTIRKHSKRTSHRTSRSAANQGSEPLGQSIKQLTTEQDNLYNKLFWQSTHCLMKTCRLQSKRLFSNRKRETYEEICLVVCLISLYLHTMLYSSSILFQITIKS